MGENVYSRVLAQLVAKESSTQAVANLLHVPEKTLERWMLGRSQMPLRAFLRALDLVVQHEGARRRAAIGAADVPQHARLPRLRAKAQT